MNGQLVGKILALRNPDRIDLADQVGDRRVGGGQLLAVPLVRGDPTHGDAVTLSSHSVPAGAADRRVWIVIDLAAVDHRDFRIEQAGQRSDQPALGLATLAQEDDVLARQDGVLDLGNDGSLEADDAGEELLARLDLADQVLAHLLLDRKDTVLTLSKLGEGRGLLQWIPLWNVVTPFRFYEAARPSAGFKSASSPAAAPARQSDDRDLVAERGNRGSGCFRAAAPGRPIDRRWQARARGGRRSAVRRGARQSCESCQG